MTLPTEVYILGQRVKLVFLVDLFDGDNSPLLGNYGGGIISIKIKDGGIPSNDVELTLWHEMFHAAMDIVGQAKDKLNPEVVCNMVAATVTSILNDPRNAEVLKWLATMRN